MLYKDIGSLVYLLGIYNYLTMFYIIYYNEHIFINYQNIN